jgi:hypothetical protein
MDKLIVRQSRYTKFTISQLFSGLGTKTPDQLHQVFALLNIRFL